MNISARWNVRTCVERAHMFRVHLTSCRWSLQNDALTEATMKQLIIAAALSLLAITAAGAQDGTCATKAVGSDGKPLSGAAKTSFLKKCKTDACAAKAVDKNGKALAGAAKASFLKKCEAAA
jgi:hypothetical protein